MKRAIIICAALIAAPVSAKPRQPPPVFKITPQQAFPRPAMNVAGTTPQQIQRGPSFKQRVENAVSRVRGRGH